MGNNKKQWEDNKKNNGKQLKAHEKQWQAYDLCMIALWCP